MEEIKKLEGPIVIFGAGGFIGANLLRAILKVRKDCYGITHEKYIPWRLVEVPVANILYADINLHETISKIFDEYPFKTIFDFATYGGYSKQQDSELIYRTNILGLSTLLEIAAKKGFSAFVHSGSSSEYGLNSSAPKESAQLLPNSHYAVSKIAAAHLINFYGNFKKLPVLNLRLYSVFGAFEEPDRLIPTLIKMGLKGKLPPLVDPEISRDFVYIDDVIRALVLSATSGVNKLPGGSINIATGKKTTIKDLVLMAKEILLIADEPDWQKMNNRSWDIKDWYGDPTLAKQVLNWEAKTSLKEGLVQTTQWLQDRLEKNLPLVDNILAADGQAVRISAVIACYGDEKAIPLMYERLTKVFLSLKVEYEIIFVNDASPDNSEKKLQEISAKDNNVLVISHSRNFGSQSSFLSGMQMATGHAVVLLDGDLQDPPEIIPQLFEKWEKGYEVVYGSRVNRKASHLLNFCYKAFYRLFRGMAYVPIPLDAGDFSLMDRKVVNELVKLPETDQFLRGLRAWVGFKQTGVDYVRPDRMFGRSTNNWRKNFWWAKKAIFSFSFVPLEILSIFGLFLTGVSFLAIVGQIIMRLLYPDTPQGISTIIVLILFFSAIQILAVSVIGEYLIKIFEETKRRPKFIRRAVYFGGRSLLSAEEISSFVEKRKSKNGSGN